MNETLERKDVVDVLKKRVDTFSSIEHVDFLKNYLVPKMEKFSDNIDNFTKDNERMRCCIQEFDVSMCTKATKASLELMRKDMETRFIHDDKLNDVMKEFHYVKNDV